MAPSLMLADAIVVRSHQDLFSGSAACGWLSPCSQRVCAAAVFDLFLDPNVVKAGVLGVVRAPPRTTFWYGHIRRVLNEASPFHVRRVPWKAWAGSSGSRGSAPSQERVRRLMREHALAGPAFRYGPGVTARRHTTAPDHGPIVPDVMWLRRDMTATVTVETRGRRSSFGWPSITRYDSSVVWSCMPPSAGTGSRPSSRSRPGRPRPLQLRSAKAIARSWLRCSGTTTWSNYLADDWCQQEVAFFGIESSPSFVRESSEGNGVGRALHPDAEGESVVGAEFQTRSVYWSTSVWPYSNSGADVATEQWMTGGKYHYGAERPAQVRREPRYGLDSGRASAIAGNTVKPDCPRSHWGDTRNAHYDWPRPVVQTSVCTW